MKQEFEKFWEKFIFISCMAGLIFLFGISLFRYYYLIPRQEKAAEDYSYIQELKNENSELRTEILSLQKKIENE